jgi:hypothetical protein
LQRLLGILDHRDDLAGGDGVALPYREARQRAGDAGAGLDLTHALDGREDRPQVGDRHGLDRERSLGEGRRRGQQEHDENAVHGRRPDFRFAIAPMEVMTAGGQQGQSGLIQQYLKQAQGRRAASEAVAQ